MSIILFAAIWLGLGWVGYVLTRWWWTADYDWTTGEAAAGIAFALLGPLNLCIGLLLAAPEWVSERTGGGVLKERRR